MKSFLKMFKKAFLVTVCMLLLCSVVYPLALTGVSQLIFPVQANGSLVDENGNPVKTAEEAVGSSVVGQRTAFMPAQRMNMRVWLPVHLIMARQIRH